MVLYDLNKALEISRALVHEYYPNAACAILTGSQTEEDFVSLVSDIDILIIDYELSGVSSEGMSYKNIRVDFTRVGLWNLVDILIDSCYSRNNTIMNMIIIGHFINDSLNLGNSLKEYCQTLYRHSNVNYFSEYQNIRRSLVMLKKHFSKELRNEQIPLTLSDFMLNISKAYLFFQYNGKYGLNGYRRSKLLYKTEKDLNFLKHINELAKNYYLNKNNQNILLQIDRFLGYSLLNTKNIQDFRYVLNINFARQNSFVFFTDIIEKIKKEPFLNKCFLYGKRVSVNAIFQYEYVLVFQNENGTLDASILERFHIIIKNSKISKRLKQHTIDAFYIKESWFNLDCYMQYEPIFGAINEAVLSLLKEDNKFNYKKMIPVFLYIVLKCRQSWDISLTNLMEALNILRNKYRPSIYYRDITHEQIPSNKRIIKELDVAFQNENAQIIDSYRQHIKQGTFFEAVQEGFSEFEKLNDCIAVAKNVNRESDNLPNYLQNIFTTVDSNASYFLVTFFDFSLKAMGLNTNQYTPVILIALSAIDDAN